MTCSITTASATSAAAPASAPAPVMASRQSPAVSSLSKEMLRKRLRELTNGERALQVDFLLHLSEFDRRKCYLDAGHGSLWSYCLRELHLREGPAARRIGAMRVLRQYPELEAPLRDGRLCMSTVTMIAPLLADHDVPTLVARAAYLTKAEVEHLVATLRPVAAPRDGVRLITSQPATQRISDPTTKESTRFAADPGAVVLGGAASADTPTMTGSQGGTVSLPGAPHGAGTRGAVLQAQDRATVPADATATTSAPPEPSAGAHPAAVGAVLATVPKSDRVRAELRPVAAEQWSLRVTMDAAMKKDLDTLESLLSHSLGGDLTSIVREALRCAVEKHGKRRGALAPARSRTAPRTAKEQGSVGPARSEQPTLGPKPVGEPVNAATTAPRPPRAISAGVRREVWARDGGCCSWRGRDGRRCGSRWKVEIDHIHPAAFGGEPTAGNLRLLCRAHNVRHAENVFGLRHMAKFGARSRGASGGAPARNDAEGADAAICTPAVDELALGSVLPEL